MSQQELLAKVVRTLESLEINYMVTGSIVSSMQGEPRATHDIDILVDLNLDQAIRLASEFPTEKYYLSEPAIRDAVQYRKMFNLLDITEGDKVDFWLLSADPFDDSRFGRRILGEFMQMNVCVSTPEDTILAKLRWAEVSGGSEKQFGDALHVYEVQFNALDLQYLNDWAAKLRVESLLKRVQDEASPIDFP